jgi:uncharacterized membrane protein YphA (DoxX/SURF4 family)
MKKQIAIEIIVFLFVVLFLYAAGSKLVEYQKFISQIGISPLLTDYAETIAWMIPTIEIIISLMLIIPRVRIIGLYAAFGLMVMFTFYIIAILSFSNELPCSCGGVLSMLGWKEHLIFNVSFVLLGLTAIILINKQEQSKIVTA